MPSVLPWWPELAYTGIQYRYERKDKAAEYAKKYKSQGLYFPYQTASTGESVDLLEFANSKEKHTGGDLGNLLK